MQDRDIEEKRNLVKAQVIAELSTLCSCNISSQNIQNDVFGCGQLDHQIIYRGRLLGSDDYSALGLLELMQSWINSDRAFLSVNFFRMRVDSTCVTRLDTSNAPDCPLIPTVTTVSETSSSAPPDDTTSPDLPDTASTDSPDATSTVGRNTPQIIVESSSAMRSGEITGIAIGAIIIILLLVILVVIVVIVLYKSKVLSKVPVRSAISFIDSLLCAGRGSVCVCGGGGVVFRYYLHSLKVLTQCLFFLWI
jgi:hypothetical protein